MVEFKLLNRQCRVVGVGNLAHFFDGSAKIMRAKQGRAADKGVRTGAGAFGDGLKIDCRRPPRYDRKFPLAPPGLGLLDFGSVS